MLTILTLQGLTTVEKVTNFTTIRVSTGPATPAGHRESVRMISKQVYNDNGLFVFDVAHMPTGCGVWPALWVDFGAVLVRRAPRLTCISFAAGWSDTIGLIRARWISSRACMSES